MRYSHPGVVGLVADDLERHRVQVELDAVVGFYGRDVANDLLDVRRGHRGRDRLSVHVLGRAPDSVDGKEDAAFEDEVVGMRRAGQPV